LKYRSSKQKIRELRRAVRRLMSDMVYFRNGAIRLENEVQMLHEMQLFFQNRLGAEKFKELRDDFFSEYETNSVFP